MKVALAARLRAETTMTVGGIAERLAMGTRGYLNHLLYRRRKLQRGQFLILIHKAAEANLQSWPAS